MRIISGECKGRKLKSIKGTPTRPTLDRVKESLFNIITPYLYQESGLDLFAGFGGLGLEALSRGVEKFCFVENNYRNIKVIEENIELCDYQDRTVVVKDDVFHFLQNTAEKFDIIMMDPPYNKNMVEESLKMIRKFELLKSDGIVAAEHEPAFKSDEIDGFQVIRNKVYGDSAISILVKGGE